MNFDIDKKEQDENSNFFFFCCYGGFSVTASVAGGGKHAVPRVGHGGLYTKHVLFYSNLVMCSGLSKLRYCDDIQKECDLGRR